MTTIPLASPSLATSSDLPEGVGRAILVFPGASSAGSPSYLVLLRAGFCLPPVLPRARCALTAPFHPYFDRGPESPAPPCGATLLGSPSERYVFCATVLRVAPTGRYPAHCPAEFGLSSPRLGASRLARGGRLAPCGGLIVPANRRFPG